MCEWDKIESEYKNSDLLDKSEFLWLRKQISQINLEDDASWNELLSEQKQIKRIIRSKITKKAINYDIDFFRYEEGIIDLYEAIISSLKIIDTCNFSSLNLVRLKAYLCLIKNTIDSFKNTRKATSLFLNELKIVIYDCLNSSLEVYFIQDVNILFLESKVEILIKIIAKEKKY